MPPLRRPEIHVWTAMLDGSARPPTLLDAWERGRADRFIHARPRADFIQSRILLRRVLAQYRNDDPAGLTFIDGPHGKPALADCPQLQFNLSHSGDCLVIAVRRDLPVGVDVEQERDLPNAAALARRFFTAGEASQIEGLPPAGRTAAFRALWTLKEAIVKADGGALACHLDRIEGTLAPDGTARFAAWHGRDAAWQAWLVFRFCPTAAHSATLATKPPAEPPRVRAWTASGR